MDFQLIDISNSHNKIKADNNDVDEYNKFEKLTRETYRVMRELKLEFMKDHLNYYLVLQLKLYLF